MSGVVCRHGIVKNLTEKFVEVTVLSESACGACHAKGSCTAAERQEKCFLVDRPSWPVAVGDRVEIRMESSLGYLAITIAYLLPVVLLVGGLFLFSALGMDDGLSAILSLGIAAVYFAVVWLFRRQMQRKFTLTIVKRMTD